MQPNVADASLLEQHKENIQPCIDGRPVSKMAKSLNMSSKSMLEFKEDSYKQREEYEKLIREYELHDDPLQVFIDYIGWTHNNFPQGSNNESGLVNLLERCTSCFRDTPYYKNDARYLKIWLEYAQYSDSPRDIFIYLIKKGIGSQLALYYEEFAKYLEMEGKMGDTLSVFELGIENNARPLVRLERSFAHFKRRNPDIPESADGASQVLRNVLALKAGDAVEASDGGDEENARKKPKIQVYTDIDEENESLVTRLRKVPQSGTAEIGSIKSRVKENIVTARPWVGEVIKQKQKKDHEQSKVQVFRDSGSIQKDDPIYKETVETSENGESYTLIEQEGKRNERVFVNVNLISPDAEEEISLDEVLAMNRMFANLNLEREDQFEEPKVHTHPDNENHGKESDDLLIDDSRHSLSRDNRQEVTQSIMIPLKGEDGEATALKRPNSPTMTMFSQFAAKEVMNIFKSAAESLSSDDDDDDDEVAANDNTTNYDGFVTETLQVPEKGPDHINIEPLGDLKTPPTDIENNTEENESADSSPFMERPSFNKPNGKVQLVNPVDESTRTRLIESLTIPISVYPGYNDHSYEESRKRNILSALTSTKNKTISKASPRSIISYGNSSFCFRYELGDGGFGTVYLVETETGEFKALKLESPASRWEFYILSQIHRRLIECESHITSMVVKPTALHYFKDESFLLIDFFPQGTVLDVVNLYASKGKPVEEVFCAFVTIELLKVVEIIHSIGVLHGDLKADNCMIRFKSTDTSRWSEHYSSEGLNGWSNKSITLIDFGRAIDLTLFDDNVQFVCNWKTDQQDCPAMRRNEPWSYEVDYYGVASIVHTLLFSKYISVRDTNNGYALESNLKRYWQHDLWVPLFDLLLNPYADVTSSTARNPIVEKLKAQRFRFESWLEKNSSSLKLKSIVQDIECEMRNHIRLA